ncbi:hypothetical protein [Hydrogenophaga sp.]|uniref:beta strand repeat-containing protein n=1 Tax=Hydrogenophaga sp. TaxID=1904254 RepID=UPI00273318BD|nr:hypothetical protein [Hydrogenophaga sp.]
MQAGVGIGSGANALETSVGTLALSAGAGGAFISEANGLIVDAVALSTLQRVNAQGGVAAQSGSYEDLRASGIGAVVVDVQQGDLTLNAGTAASGVVTVGAGHVRLNAATGSIGLNAVLLATGAASISVLAGTNLTMGVAGDITTAGLGTVDLQAGGAISMEDGTVVTTSTGNIRVVATGLLRLGALSTAGDVSLGAGSITDAGTSGTNVTADELRIVTTGTSAGEGVGIGSNHLEIDVRRVAASVAGTGTGGLFLTERNAIDVGALSVITVNRVNTDATTTDVSAAVLGGLISSGHVVLQTQAGGIDTVVGSGVVTAAGNVLINAVGSGAGVTLAAALTSTGGAVSLAASAAITFTAEGDVSTVAGASGTVDLQAGAAIAMAGGAVIQTVGAAVRAIATGDITLGQIDTRTTADRDGNALNAQSAWGSVSLTSSGGSILDNANASVDVYANSLRLTASAVGKGLGSSLNAVELEVATMSALAGSGGAYLSEASAVAVNSVAAVSVDRVGVTGTTSIAVAAGAQEDLVSGAELVVVSGGALTVNGGTNASGVNAAGNVLLQTNSGDINLNATLVSSAGNVSLNAVTGSIVLAATGDLSTQGAGKTIDLLAGGSITMADGTLVSSTDGNVRVQAINGDVTVGEIAAGTATVAVLASGSVFDLGDSGAVDITAGSLILSAGVAIGSNANALETSVGNLSAKSTNGGTWLAESDAVTVTNLSLSVNRVDSSGSDNTNGTAIDQEDLVSGAELVVVSGGALTVNGGTNASGVSAVGNILLQTNSGDINLNATLLSSAGNVSINAVLGSIVMAAAGDVSTSAANQTIDLLAGTSVVMADGTLVSSTDGNVRVQAINGDVTVGEIAAGTATVALLASGSVLDLGDSDAVDITAGSLILSAGAAIGSNANALETSVGNLSAKSTSGGTWLAESDAVTVTNLSLSVNRVGGSGQSTVTDADTQEDLVSGAELVLVSGGALTVQAGTANTDGVSAVGNILLQTNSGDINLNAALVSIAGNVSINAVTGHIVLAATGDLSTQGAGKSIDLLAGTSVVMADGTLVSSTDGNVRVQAINGDVTVGEIAAGTATVALLASGSVLDLGDSGAVDITAGSLILSAGAAIGSNANALETSVGNLSAKSTSGGTWLAESDTVTVTNLSLTVQRVSGNGTDSVTSADTQEDLVSGAELVLVSGGALTVQAGTANTDGVSATGNILLQSTVGDVTLNAGLVSSAGNVSVTAQETLNVAATVRSAEQVSLQSVSGDIVLNADVTSGTDFRLEASAGKVNLNAALTSTTGSTTSVVQSGVGVMLGDQARLGGANVLPADLGQTIQIGGVAPGDPNVFYFDTNGQGNGGVGTWVIGSDSHTGDIVIQGGSADSPLVFDCQVEVRAAAGTRVVITGVVEGVSLSSSAAIQLDGASLLMSGGIAFANSLTLTGAVELRAGSVEFAATVTTGQGGASLSLLPLGEPGSTVEIGDSNQAFIDTASLANISGFDRLLIGDASAGTLNVSGAVVLNNAAAFLGDRVAMAAGSSINSSGNVTLASQSGVEVSQVVSSGTVTVRVENASATIQRSAGQAAGAVNIQAQKVVLSGFGPVSGSTGQALRVDAAELTVLTPGGMVVRQTQPDGSVRVLGLNQGVVHEQLVNINNAFQVEAVVKPVPVEGWEVSAPQNLALRESDMSRATPAAFATGLGARLAEPGWGVRADLGGLGTADVSWDAVSIEGLSSSPDDGYLLTRAYLLGEPASQPSMSGLSFTNQSPVYDYWTDELSF